MNAELQENIFAPEDVANHKAHAVCAYLHIIIGLPLFLVPLLAAPDSRFARFHGDQGLTHFLALFAGGLAWVLAGVLVLMFSFIPILGQILGLIWILLGPCLLVFWYILGILGIVNIAKGQGKRLPLIGRWTILGPQGPPKNSA